MAGVSNTNINSGRIMIGYSMIRLWRYNAPFFFLNNMTDSMAAHSGQCAEHEKLILAISVIKREEEIVLE
jgi:hypothetical protein